MWNTASLSPFRAALALAGVAVLSVGALGGCAYQEPAATATAPSVSTEAPQQVVAYPTGRYELRGRGTAGSPHYWVWVPSNVAVYNPPTLPTAPSAVAAPGDRVRVYPEGRYELLGSGTPSAPYYWVWIPTGTTPPPFPPAPRQTP
jgi:hypothetical protein